MKPVASVAWISFATIVLSASWVMSERMRVQFPPLALPDQLGDNDGVS